MFSPKIFAKSVGDTAGLHIVLTTMLLILFYNAGTLSNLYYPNNPELSRFIKVSSGMIYYSTGLLFIGWLVLFIVAYIREEMKLKYKK